MAHRSGRGGGYTRGSSGFRQKGRNSGSPYWKDKPTGLSNAIETEPSNMVTPVREPPMNREPLPVQSPADEGKQNKEAKKFSNKSRLFIANLPRDTTEDELKKLFSAYGEVQEVFIQKEKSFAFCRMAYKSEAEAAIAAMNGYTFKGKVIKVRMAASTAVVKVDNIHTMVTNELLQDAFSQFGEVEEAVVVTDIRGKSKGWGIVEFVRKQSAMNAVAQCKNCPFFLTRTPIPVVVTEYERENDTEGQPFKSMAKTAAFQQECEIGPRFATPSDVEFSIGQRWLATFEEERIQRNELEIHIKKNRDEVKKALVDVREQHQTELMRQELVHHQQEQMRLLMQLKDREGGLLHLPGLPPGASPPLFPGDRPESDPPVRGVGAPPLFPQPLMGPPGFENFH